MAPLPDQREGFFIVNHGESGDLRLRVKQALLDALYPAKPVIVPPPIRRMRRALHLHHHVPHVHDL